MTHTRLAVTPSAERREAVSAALFGAGASGLLEDGPRFVTIFDSESDARIAEAAVRRADDGASTLCEPFDPGDWSAEWRRGVGAHQVGAVRVVPPWLASADANDIEVVIDPAMGFGTGEHETTRLMLHLLQRTIRRGDIVADVGTGSGVLAIAAAKLGALRVAAIENDPLAIGNAQENVARNGVDTRVTVLEGDGAVFVPLLAPHRVIVANIIASVLTEMLPVLVAALTPGGAIIVGGILRTERDAFVESASALGVRVVHEAHEGDWWSAELCRASD